MALEFQIELGGNFVEALQQSKKGLDETEKGTHKAEKALEAFEGELGKVKVGALGINFNAFQDGGHFLSFDLAKGAELAFEAIRKVGEAVYDLGKEIVKAAADAEDLNLAIKLDVGEEGADKVDKLAESFKGTRFSPKLIKQALLPILEESGDEHNEQWDDLVTAATDVAVRRNTGAAGAKSALEALRGIEIQPQKIRGSLKELGIKQKDFYDDLGDLLGISAQAAEKQVKAGKVKSQTLLSVALNQIAQREGGSLGNATNEGSKTLGATLERLGNLKETMFERLAGSQGMKAVQGFLDNFITTLEGPIGTDLVAKIGSAFETLFGDLSGPDGLQLMEDGVGGIAKKVGDFIDQFVESWPQIKQGFSDTLDVFTALGKTIAAIASALAALPRIGDKIGDFVAKGAMTPEEAGAGDDPLARWVKRKIHGDAAPELGPGPSMSVGSDLVESVPHMAAGGIVSRPTLALVGEAGPEAITPLGRGGAGGGLTINYGDININGAGQDKDSIAQAVRIEIKRTFDEAAAAFGAAA